MEDLAGCRFAAKTARPRREGGLGLDWGVAARRLEEFVDSGEILTPEPVRGGHAIKLLRGCCAAAATATGTRFSRAALTARARSLAIRSLMNPGAYCRLEAALVPLSGYGDRLAA